MENYVVRIYRRSAANPENITGMVERPDIGENKSFNNKEEFNNIFWPSSLGNASSTKLKKTLEFRRYRRFLIKEATVIFESNTDIGEIIDISMGGMSFNCPNIPLDSKKQLNIGILLGNKDFQTDKIKCRPIINGNRLNSLDMTSQLNKSRMSVEFEDLTHKQTAQLRNIIQNYTLGEA
jgi:hypothetical protein